MTLLFVRRALAPALVFAVCGIGFPAHAQVSIDVISSRPDMISNSDALIEVKAPANGVRPNVKRGTTGVSGNFTEVLTPNGDHTGIWRGKVGSISGTTTVMTATHGNITAMLDGLKNHPIAGPIISGPHESPYWCTATFNLNSNFELPNLGLPNFKPTNNSTCSATMRTDYVYRTPGGAYKRMTNLGAYPSDLRRIDVNGKTNVPYIVRIETGVINRAIYQTAALHDVVAATNPSLVKRGDGWTGKLIYRFGGGCEKGWYQQGKEVPKVLEHDYLLKGYAVASSSLNVMGQNCNDLLSSETVMMVKERFIEAYGPVEFTIGIGSSGGSYQSHQTADNYPGVLDGIIVSQAFPDVTSATIFKAFDSRLLLKFFTDNGGYSPEQKQAISGFRMAGNVTQMSIEAVRIDPTGDFVANFPFPQYHPTQRPTGARASVYDHTRNVYGVDGNNYALRPIENVGVQYGLRALHTPLNQGGITLEQFLQLNERIGGLDRDLKHTPADGTGFRARTSANDTTVQRAYQSGRILFAGNGLKTTPIIDKRSYRDDDSNGDVHNSIHSFSVRARLRAGNNDRFGNHVILRSEEGDEILENAPVDPLKSLPAMDAWLSSIKADDAPLTYEKVVAHIPDGLVDACLKRNGLLVKELQLPNGPSECAQEFPAGETPRMAAGNPSGAQLADNVVQCQLRAPTPADYGITETQFLAIKPRLDKIFPSGVCDWSQARGRNHPNGQTWWKVAP